MVGVVGGAVVLGVVTGCDAPPPPRPAPGPGAGASKASKAPPRPEASGAPGASKPVAPPGSAAGGPAPETCPEGGVQLREGFGDAAMGLRVADIELVNCGTQPYVLDGYPEVRLLDKQRVPVEVAVVHGSDGITTSVPSVDGSPQRVELQPGQAATVALVWRNLVNDSTVPAAEGWVLDVRPRPGAPRVGLELTHSVDLGNTGKLGIGPWTAAAR
ncbi:DUF4232 domain-containing protein [Streptomyces sp. NPDC006430]|uniref:DUF4232 domain-containing protein n=1 Tax=Streptomyces sp. NPDC006430 TaxID=3154299 RepID=UPI0033AF10A2